MANPGQTVLVVVLIALLVPSQASAGGWWSSPRTNPPTVAAGQRVRVSFYAYDATRWGTTDRGPYFVYLLRGFDDSVLRRAMRTNDPGPWWTIGGATATRVARVEPGRTSFTVPALAPGRYAVMLCDAGCRHPLGDLLPGRLTILADRRMAEHAQRLRRLEARLDDQATVLRSARLAITDMSLRLDELQAAVRHASQRKQPEEGDVPLVAAAGWLIAGLLVGGCSAAAARRRRGAGRDASLPVYARSTARHGRARRLRGHPRTRRSHSSHSS